MTLLSIMIKAENRLRTGSISPRCTLLSPARRAEKAGVQDGTIASPFRATRLAGIEGRDPLLDCCSDFDVDGIEYAQVEIAEVVEGQI
jgi:hypothetical protein